MAVTPVTSTKINVTFSEGVDDTVSASNFTISDGASVTGVEFNGDRTVATLIANGLASGKEYTLTVSGVTAGDDKLAEDFTTTFVAIKDEYKLLLDSGLKEGNVLKADGISSTTVKVSLVNALNEVVEAADSVELKFDTTAGNFANQTVTVQKGVAENTFTSESLVTPKTAMITVTIIKAADPDLVNTTEVMNIVMDPNPGTSVDDSIGAMLTDVKVQTADRVALFFNKEVNVTDYTNNNKNKDWDIYGYNEDKLKVVINDSAKGLTRIPVYALSAVPGNSRALYAYTGNAAWDRQELTDNAEITVTVTDKTKAVPVESNGKAILQDITNPSLLSVTNEGLTTLVLTFSEPVNWSGDNGADNLNNYVIDGVPLTNPIYGVVASPAAIDVSGFNKWTGEDFSNIVKIKLGKNANGKQIYMTAGNHSVQASNIGDVANRTDVNNNKLITQTLDFMIDPDDSLVTAEVLVQSPEQYIVKLNKEIDNPQATLAANLKLQVWNAQTGQYVDVNTANQGITVTEIGNDHKTFRIDTTKDWTVYYNTASTHKNYYNDSFRLYIAKDTIENPGNGKLNAEISMVLSNLSDAIMTNPDVTSPEIKDVKLNSDNSTFDISLSEPVQVPGHTQLTPNQTQNTNDGVPAPTVSFIKSDNSITIPATIVGVDDYHSTITVRPQAELSAGTWKVVVYSISDDVGNTAATLVKPDFEVKATVVAEDGFRALWIVAVPAGKADPVAGGSHANNDVVYVKYNKNIATAGSSANVVSTANYQINGYSIPVSTKIDVSIQGYNADVLSAYGVNGVKDIIAINLNKGTLASNSNNVYLANTLQSAKGALIANGGLKTLNKDGDIFRWQYNKVSGTDVDTKAELSAAIANEGNVEVTATTGASFGDDPANDTYTISKAMAVDFSGLSAKSLTIDTEATGTVTVKNLTVTGNVTINAPYANVKFENVIVTAANSKVTLNNVCKSFNLDATTDILLLDITSNITHDIEVKGVTGSNVTTLNNNAQAKVTIDPLTIGTLNQLSAKALVLEEVTVTTLNIKAAASLSFTGAPSTVTTLNVEKNVKIASVDKSNGSTITTVKKDVTFNTDGTVKDAGTGSDLNGVSNEVKGDSSSNVPTPGPGDSGTATGAAISA